MKKKYNTLSVEGALLDNEQLELYMKKIAADHILSMKSSKKTFPIPRVKDNLKFISEVYNVLNDDIKNNLPIHPAGEWLLDNFYIIEKNAKIIIKDLNLKKYTNLIGIANGSNKGFARAFIVAKEIISYTDGKVDGDSIEFFLKAYQSKKTLSMDELWNMSIFLRIVLIEKIRGICEKIYLSQMQKRKVENIVSRLVEFKEEKLLLKDKKIKVYDTADSKYPFIEYMSYRLKKYGQKAYNYIAILEEEVNKMGSNITECINREHYDIAAKKVSIGNSISSINALNRLNYVEIFNRINGVEEILKNDPVKVYEKMDYNTKEYYRNEIKKISEKSKISELYIAKKCLELAKDNNSKKDTNIKKSHVGYYIVDEGKKQLLEILLNKKIRNNNTNILPIISFNLIISIIISTLIGYYLNLKTNNLVMSFLAYIFLIFIIKNIFGKIIQYISGKLIKPKTIPKLDFSEGVPDEYTTMVVIPTIINNKEKVVEVFKKLEVYYLANKSDNIFFTLLGDCTSETKEKMTHDDDVINTGVDICRALNEKYNDVKFPKFNFIYRKRQWCSGENSYLGWERKRGLLTQFNEYILGKESNKFLYNSFENTEEKLPKIKYIITLDSDTNLCLNTGLELIGAMAHILNKPEIDEEKNIIKNGYGIIQPRVGIGIEEANKSIFSKLFSGVSGTDSYTNAISDFYQDNFREGIYTGKGIFDTEIFSKILKSEIPPNKILSHDLLEGCYLKCGLASDIVLMDGFPSTYDAYRSRSHRWIRGDYQIVEWLFKGKINILSKFKIIDNLLRSMHELVVLILIFLGSVLNSKLLLIVPLVSICFPYILNIVDKIIMKKSGQFVQKKYNKEFGGTTANLLKATIDIALIPDKAYLGMDAAIRSLYRLFISKKHLLEWTTSEENEKKAKSGIFFYYKKMIPNVLFGFIFVYLGVIYTNFIGIILGVLWIIFPIIINRISKPIVKQNVYNQLDESEKKYVYEIGRKTWNYFKDFLNEENNYLPPDNYQEDRKNEIVYRTSPTNIGLALISVASSFDLGYESKAYVIDLIEKMIKTIEKLPKWNGHLYNWYNICELTPLFPQYVSSVDSGNFVGYLYVLKQFLIKESDDSEKIKSIVKIIDTLIDNTDFSKLFDFKTGLFSIGFNCEENKMTDSYYDLLASEARQTSIVAIAKKDISAKHWKNLSRSLTTLNKYKGLISWSGTAFEYLMPAINIKRYPGSLLDESCKFMIMSQIEYSKKLGVTWGISEAAFNLKDFNGNYQYKAFGIPWLGLKRGLADEIVVSSYGTILAINDIPKKVINNLKQLESIGMYGKYGFFESVDYTPSRAGNNKYSVVKTYMAHHQGLILLSINNLINDNILQKRFSYNPEIESVDILLQEKMPDNIIITKEKKEHIEKIKYYNYDYYSERKYENNIENINMYNLICNNNYSVLIDNNGNGYSKYKNYIVNRYKQTDEINDGITFFMKNLNNNDIWNPLNESKNKIVFYPDKSEFINEHNKIKSKLSIFIAAEDLVEIRKLNIKNSNEDSIKFEIYSIFEPVLSEAKQDYAHKAFNKLFLSFDIENNILITKRRSRTSDEKDIYMAATFVSEDDQNIQFDTDKLNIFGRNNYGIPDVVKSSKSMRNSIESNVNQAIAFKKNIEISNGDEKNIFLIIGVSNSKEKAVENVKKYCNSENVTRAMKLSRAQIEAKVQYLGITGKDVNLYERILSHMLNKCGKQYTKADRNLKLYPSKLWRYGISGEKPILLLEINEISETDIVKNIVKCYEFLKIQGMEVDFIILNNEPGSYENYLQDAINEIIWSNMDAYNNGIYTLKNIPDEDKEIIRCRADIIIPGRYGKIEFLLEELENEKSNKIKMYNCMENTNNDHNYDYKFDMNELKFFNEYGGFNQKEYVININKNKTTPVAWSNVLANEKFGTIITENMGGYTWYKNARLNRITAWNNDAISDFQSELIYFVDSDTNYSWNASLGPIKDQGEYHINYGLGYANYVHFTDSIEQNINVFVPQNDAVKISIISLKNLLPQKRKIKIEFYLKLALDEDEILSRNYIYCEENKNDNYILLKNLANENFDYWMYLSSSEKIINSEFAKNVLKIGVEIEIAALEEKNLSLFFGCDDNENNCKEFVEKYQNVNCCRKELEDTKKYWNSLTEKISIKTPEESINYICNGWIIYQAYCCRMLAKSGYYQSGGAWGFRDQLQDSMCMKYFDLNIQKNQIIRHCKHQFIEGDVLHWWHDETGRGVRTKFSDDLLWLVYIVCDYIEFSGDYDILDTEVPYLLGKILDENLDEKYDFYGESDVSENVYLHCVRAIEKALNYGEHGIPKIGSGDWNDGFNFIGNKGKGESVWLGFFLYDILRKFISICEYKKDDERKNNYEKICIKLKDSLNENCWDGKWYNRAFCDNGAVVGSIQNKECKIDGISQSWAVISKVADNQKGNIAMKSLRDYLVDKEVGIIKLLYPPFESGDINPGYIRSYLPGTRENGGQYTHGAIWAIIAEAMLNNGKNATEYFKMINPIQHSLSRDLADQYKLEPYVIAADIYANNDMPGQGGWSWYTGSASWYYICLIKYILGIQIRNGILNFEPHVPAYWKKYSIIYKYGNSVYNIKFNNMSGNGSLVQNVLLNGNEVKDRAIKLDDNGSVNEIDVTM